ncbi:hypothetical protein VTO73DRAFT_13012 [Trametes versicolor]
MGAAWEALRPFFQRRGYMLWKRGFDLILWPDIDSDDFADTAKRSSGYEYATQHRGLGPAPGSISNLFAFQYLNALCRAARKADGTDVVIRVLAIGDFGRKHVEVLKVLSMGPYAFYEDNHAIPLLEFVDFGDVTFGVFPKIGGRVEEAYRYWPKNSVGDVLDMILQCLEALVFIHTYSIAHMDAFKDNFLVEWHPESLTTGHVARSRPRVYLTDFETAVMFSDDTPLEECIVTGYPKGDSYLDDITKYARAVPPEVLSGMPYDPFKLDVWQFGKSLENFRTAVPDIDRLLDALILDDAKSRPSSFDALEYLSRVIAEMPPKALLIPPETDAPPL